MESLAVTLIVKAPNQQIEDQKIKCQLSWSVIRLKQYLSQVYPGRPPQREQKLIYSGQLLKDTMILKDILRQYEGQDTHTLHLVYTPIDAQAKQKNYAPVRNLTCESSRDHSLETELEYALDEVVLSSSSSTANESGSQHAPCSQWLYFHGQQMSSASLNQYQMQMLWMQQAYSLYIAQYRQLAAGEASHQIPFSVRSTFDSSNINILPNDAANQQEQVQAAPQAPPAIVNENPERDWLDVFYMMSRAMVLFSVVYFYSSPVRFIIVLFLGLTLYLYQTGFFTNINNNNHINAPSNAVPEEEQVPTRLMVVWTFLTTFFASLIPEVPNAV